MHKRVVIILLVLLLLSLAGNFFLLQHMQQTSFQSGQSLRLKYPLLSARALNPNYANNLTVNFLPLRQQIHQQVDPYADTFAIYFEYLPTGTTIGINEDHDFTAESLLKVPVVMAYFRKKERTGVTSDPTVKILPSELNAKFGDLYKKGVGYEINLGDAVKLALQKSDNTASLVIADQISNDDFQFVYDGLDIPEMVTGKTPIITAQEYSSVLKALYFGSVLNNEDSQEILSLLTQTDFKDMLPSGVPAGIPVAHKIGLVNGEIYQDCGIVYVPQAPYSLCMVSKSNKKTAEQRMHTLSKMVYDYVNSLQRSDEQGQ
jgi:beta-lactamase class A